MKRLLFVFVALISLTLVTGCANEDDTLEFGTSTNSDQEQETVKEDEMDDQVEPEQEESEVEEGVNEQEEATETTEATNTEEVESEASEEIEAQDEPITIEIKPENEAVAQEETVQDNQEETQETEEVLEESQATEAQNTEENQVAEEDNEEVEAEETPTKEDTQEQAEENNAIAESGTLSISSFEGSDLETRTGYNVIRGNTAANTHSITVNGYKLQKYYPGQTQWSYIASTRFKTLEEGNNEYLVKAFDAQGNEIASMEFSVDFTQVDSHELPGVGASAWISILAAMGITSLYQITRRKSLKN